MKEHAGSLIHGACPTAKIAKIVGVNHAENHVRPTRTAMTTVQCATSERTSGALFTNMASASRKAGFDLVRKALAATNAHVIAIVAAIVHCVIKGTTNGAESADMASAQ